MRYRSNMHSSFPISWLRKFKLKHVLWKWRIDCILNLLIYYHMIRKLKIVHIKMAMYVVNKDRCSSRVRILHTFMGNDFELILVVSFVLFGLSVICNKVFKTFIILYTLTMGYIWFVSRAFFLLILCDFSITLCKYFTNVSSYGWHFMSSLYNRFLLMDNYLARSINSHNI